MYKDVIVHYLTKGGDFGDSQEAGDAVEQMVEAAAPSPGSYQILATIAGRIRSRCRHEDDAVSRALRIVADEIEAECTGD